MVQRCCVILTTTDDQQVVDKLTISLLEANLAACIQVDNIVSYFKWEGKISSVPEFRIVVKAKSDNYNAIEKMIIDIHNYDLPQIIKLDIQDGLPAYLNWVTQSI
ncbi:MULTISPECIES: divalent-cation tolerance protein CutA [Rickettsieae]|uniref:divalent-cation tolerance protein CutA n=1 Tax=Rickettsieae TaxID=33988 RepID=UPI000B9C6520|nr:divalent cation tolerance protein CutA [Rickettsia endosymbiont of Culicoides newsteadi]MCC8400187.1 divalent cation tolerance protein CutA [Rickettsia endosymbiont of Platyusa sonomae]OZG32454.1 divalent-cation tolerance protein CutA [Rickettsia endosymbiont of Culicoides newsteadi]HJD63475.1 divalent cation tolerance protein CutA [Rickettsia endosymbiont of Sericostoma sp.]